jgi:FKBP-type peptidyl-prolyl cis-trans isomerase
MNMLAMWLIFPERMSNFPPFNGTILPGPFLNRAALLPMKFITKLTAGFVGMGLFFAAFAQNAPAPASAPIKFELPKVGSGAAQPAAGPTLPAAPAAPAVKFTQAQLMEVYGFMMAMRMNLPELEFTTADADSMAKGIKMALTHEEPSYDAKALSPQLQEFIAQKQQVLLLKIHNANVAEGTAYFAKLKENKAVQILPSGLGIEVIKAAAGQTVKVGQLAKFHYTLSALNGQVMETSAGREPLEALVQDGAGMIPGMMEGLQKIPVGAKYKLYIPYQLAYGDQGTQGIPPGASLIFEVEMLDVKDAPKEAAPAATK